MIELTDENVEKLQRELAHVPEKIPKAASRAINRAADSAKTEASRKVREEYHMKHKDVISTVKILRASEGDMSASVISSGSVMPLTKFKVNPSRPSPKRKASITVRVKRGGGGNINGGFVAGMGSGHNGVFTRVGKSRLPLRQHYGPSVPQMLGSETVGQYVEEKASETLVRRLEHEISRAIGGS